jgi:hypothetical protein
MRAIALSFLLVSINAISVLAQEVTYGMKGGLNISDVVIQHYINPDAESKFTMKLGPHFGVFASMKLTEQLSFAAELLYSNKGVHAGTRINLNYLNLPLLIRYNLSKKFLLEAGPELGYLASARSRYGNVSNTWNNKLDFCLDAGLQYRLSEKTSVGARYSFGLLSVITNVDDSNSNYIPSGNNAISYQNRTVQFFVAYAIGKKLID